MKINVNMDPQNSKEITLKSSDQFEALFQYSTIGIIITNNQGSIVNVNPMAEQIFGFSKTEMAGQRIEMLLPENIKQKHEALRDNFYENPHNRAMGAGRDLYAKRKDGELFPVEVSLSHFKIEGALFVMAFIIDISIRKESEKLVINQKHQLEIKTNEILDLNIHLENKIEDRTKMLKETLSELESSREELNEAFLKEKELGELKSRFVTMASHEFRTPLSTILSSVSLLEKYTESSEQDKRNKHIHRIKNAVDSMKNILEDFLSIGKLEEGTVEESFEIIGHEELVSEIQSTISDIQTLTKNGQHIYLEHSVKGEIETDIKLLKNILINLLSNAIKFSPENSQIQIIIKNDKDYLLVSVKDEGMGISSEDQTHLFQRFFRGKNAINIQGTGLGLHIIARYLELLNGEIAVKSKLGNGTEFIIRIPVAQKKI